MKGKCIVLEDRLVNSLGINEIRGEAMGTLIYSLKFKLGLHSIENRRVTFAWSEFNPSFVGGTNFYRGTLLPKPNSFRIRTKF